MIVPVATSTARAAVRPSESDGAVSAFVSLRLESAARPPSPSSPAAQAIAATASRSARRITRSTVDGDRDGAPSPGQCLRRRRHPEIDDVALDRRPDVGGHRRPVARDEDAGAERDHRRIDRDHADPDRQAARRTGPAGGRRRRRRRACGCRSRERGRSGGVAGVPTVVAAGAARRPRRRCCSPPSRSRDVGRPLLGLVGLRLERCESLPRQGGLPANPGDASRADPIRPPRASPCRHVLPRGRCRACRAARRDRPVARRAFGPSRPLRARAARSARSRARDPRFPS